MNKKISVKGKGQKLYLRAKKLIPGGTQLFSKRPELFLPGLWPAYHKKASGCEVWGLDGNKFLDMSYMGIGSCILGYADQDVNAAVKKVIDSGSMSTLNPPEEVELARLLLKLHPWSKMARFCRSGGEAMSMAVRIARAKTKRDIVLFCGYHGWHDWYLSANLASNKSLDGHLLPGLNPLGVPRKLQGTSYPFRYNDTKGFLKLVKQYQGKVGAVILESIRNDFPQKEFIAVISRVCRENKIVLIVDEITAGFRLNPGGAHLLFGLEPDIAVFAKGMSNGFPMAAIIGKKKVMEVAQDSFISSTYWTERIGPAAALATINKFKKFKVHNHLVNAGKRIQSGWKDLAARHDLKVEIGGIYPLSHFSFVSNKPMVLKTLFTQFMLEKGILATTAFYASYSHKKSQIDRYLKSVDEAFAFIKKAIDQGKPEKHLKTTVCHSGFKRLN
jgi:glutamate-1-semialdehyde 2,1-aminomutase